MKTKTFKLGKTRMYPLWWVPTVEVRHANGTVTTTGILTVAKVTDVTAVEEGEGDDTRSA